jgi:hypothetical protein
MAPFTSVVRAHSSWDHVVMKARPPVIAIGLALTFSTALAVYPAGEASAVGFGLTLDLALLVLATRGRLSALNVLTASLFLARCCSSRPARSKSRPNPVISYGELRRAWRQSCCCGHGAWQGSISS